MTDDIKDFALDIGYNKVGITSTESFERELSASLTSRSIFRLPLRLR